MALSRDTSLWWNMAGIVAAYQPIAAPGPRMARYNQAMGGTNAYRADDGTPPTWAAATGWSFALVSSQYLTTGITIPDTTYSAIARFSDVTVAPGVNEGYLIGSFLHLDAYWGIAPVGFAGDNNVTYAWGKFVAIAPKLATGVLALAGLQPYRNGIAEASTVPSGGTTSGKALYIGAVNGSAGYYLTGKIQALAIYARTLSPAEVMAVSRQMAYCERNPEWNVWDRRRTWYLPVLAMAYNQAAAGAMANAGALVRGTSTSKAGALTNSGAISRAVAVTEAGVLTGAGGIVRETAASKAGAWSSAGDIARLIATAKSGAMANAGTIARATSKALAGAWSGAGALARAIGKAIAGAWSGSGTGSGELVTIGLISLTLFSRQVTLTLHTRGVTLTVEDR